MTARPLEGIKVVEFGQNLAGLYCGQILDKFKAADNVTGGYAILFSICAFAYLITFAVHHLLAPRFEPIHLKHKAT